tara:strand:+ start:772 stop:2064 length:1293 start_codon:yes stop_codon:yes gene_type:complete
MANSLGKRFRSKKLHHYLQNSNEHLFHAYCILAAFTTYFCMYAFRKPFSVATFEAADQVFEVDYKIILITAQVLGYTLSKFMGIKVVSEVKGKHRGKSILLLIGIAELALLGFALTPAPYNILFMFLNGMPLGMVWGLVFGYLEGRKSTELLGAGLSASYIVASGAVKSVGKYFLQSGVSEFYMPLVVGLCFAPLLLIAVFLLNNIPKPTKEDEQLRTKRKPMYDKDRWRFFKTFAPGLFPLTLLYMLLTAYRDFRDNFAREIWDAVGYGGRPELFTATEIPIAFAVLISLATIMYIRNNQKALMAIHILMLFGSVLIGLSTLAFQLQWINPITWMTTIGLGLYLAYVPYGCVLFDRLIAATKFIGTAGFMIYLTDAFGYLGSVFLMFYKNFGQPNLSWLDFFISYSYVTSIFCGICFIISLRYFLAKTT